MSGSISQYDNTAQYVQHRDQAQQFLIFDSANPEKLIWTVSVTLNGTSSGRLNVSPSIWIGGHPPVGMGMGNGRQI